MTSNQPLERLDDWDEFVAERYSPGKSREQFRDYVLPS